MKEIRGEDLIHLIRFDYKKSKGWAFRVPPWFPDGPASYFFSASRFGGFDAAYLAAKKFRDEMFAAEGAPLRLGWFPDSAKNNSGIVGVFLAEANRAGLSRFGWIALWSENGKSKKKTFSVQAHGFDTALGYAVKMREQATNQKFSTDEIQKLREYGIKKIEAFFGTNPYA